MSIRSVTCPGCGAVANVPAAMANVKCPACATVWNVNRPAAAQNSGAEKKLQGKGPSEQKRDKSTPPVAIIAGLVGAAMVLFAMIGLAAMILSRQSPPPEASAEVEETIKPIEPEEYRVVNLPESQRRLIYKDYRATARTNVEKPLALPQGGPRMAVEGGLQAIFDREIRRFAALHDVTVEDIKEVIKEGDAKVWDGSPRSNATRDGKRVYAKEKSEGWKKSTNRK